MNNNELMHFGILGMKWGVRRYQNEDGTLTAAGKKRYDENSTSSSKNAISVKSAGYKALSKVYDINANYYSKHHMSTIAGMNRTASSNALKKAEKAQQEANVKRDAKKESKTNITKDEEKHYSAGTAIAKIGLNAVGAALETSSSLQFAEMISNVGLASRTKTGKAICAALLAADLGTMVIADASAVSDSVKAIKYATNKK